MACADIVRSLVRWVGLDIRRIHNVPEMTFLGRAGENIRLILDVGANDGVFARVARKMFPAASIYCFEPLPLARGRLEQWVRRDSSGKVHVVPVAVGDRSGEATLFEHQDHDSSSSLLQTTALAGELFPFVLRQEARVVAVTTLDEWSAAAKVQVGPGTLLKIDVQGYESAVLRGGANTLACVDLCMLEVNFVSLYDQQSSFAEICGRLETGGLTYVGNISQTHARDGSALFADALFARRQKIAQSK
jgi:FkbM family methyltransferase